MIWMSFPRFDGHVTADGTVQRIFCSVKNKIQFTNILFIISKNCLVLLFIYINSNALAISREL